VANDFGDFGTRQKLNGRDLVKPYVDACRKHGLKVAFTSHPQTGITTLRLAASGLPRRDGEMHHSTAEDGNPQVRRYPLPEVQKYF